DDRGRKRRRNFRVAHIGNVLFTVDFEIVDLGTKGLAYLCGRPRKIDYRSTGIDHVDGETMGLKPIGNRAQVLVRQTEPVPEFRRIQPPVEVRRIRRVKLIKKLL